MALKAGYYGLKKSLLNKLQHLTGIYSLDAETLELSSAGELKVIGGSGGTTVEGNPQDEATDTLSKIKIGTTVYDVPDTTYSEGTGIDVSGQNVISLDADINDLDDVDIINPQDGQILQYDATSQKWVNHINAPEYISKIVDIYSAASDTVTFTDETGVKTVTTDTSGHGIASIICINGDSITFTSSVAKNPSDLSQDYSKTVNITLSTSAIYVMPNDNVLYWYGYKSGNLESLSTENGWSVSATFREPTYETNKISLSSSSGIICGIGNKNAISNHSKFCTIYKGITMSSGNYGVMEGDTSKTISGTGDQVFFNSNTITYAELSTVKSYGIIFNISGRSSEVYALWYE